MLLGQLSCPQMSFLGEAGSRGGVHGQAVSPALVVDVFPCSLVRIPITAGASLPIEHPGLATWGIFTFKDGKNGMGKIKKENQFPPWKCQNLREDGPERRTWCCQSRSETREIWCFPGLLPARLFFWSWSLPQVSGRLAPRGQSLKIDHKHISTRAGLVCNPSPLLLMPQHPETSPPGLFYPNTWNPAQGNGHHPWRCSKNT